MASAAAAAVEDMMVIATCSLISNDTGVRALNMADVSQKKRDILNGPGFINLCQRL